MENKNYIEKSRNKWNKFSDAYVNFAEMISLKSISKNIDKYFSGNNKKIDYLELACGSGLLSEYIIDKYSNRLNNIYLHDLADEMINKTKNRFQNKKIKNLIIEQKNCYDIKVEENKYDLIIASLILHMVNNPELMIERIKKMLKKDGVLIISILAPLKENSFFMKGFGILKKYIGPQKKGHNIFKLAEENNMKDMLEKFDLKLEDFYKTKELLTNKTKGLLKMYLKQYDLKKNKDISEEEKGNMIKELEGLVADDIKTPLEFCMHNYYVKNT